MEQLNETGIQEVTYCKSVEKLIKEGVKVKHPMEYGL